MHLVLLRQLVKKLRRQNKWPTNLFWPFQYKHTHTYFKEHKNGISYSKDYRPIKIAWWQMLNVIVSLILRVTATADLYGECHH